MIFDSQIKKSAVGKFSDKFDLSNLDLLMHIREKGSKTSVLCIEFSSKGEMLAVSYDNSHSSQELEVKLENEFSYISIFSKRVLNTANKQKIAD